MRKVKCFAPILLVLGFVNCATLCAQQSSQEKLIKGQWYVVATNFPMWLNGKNLNPIFNYSNFETKNGLLKFEDFVVYSKNNSQKILKGRDKQKDSTKLKFAWRGKGFLALFGCSWTVIASDAEGQWMVIYSTKTLASPEGVDVLSRNKKMPEKEIKNIITHLQSPFIKKTIQILN